MPQRICSNDSNQFFSFTIWYTRGTDLIYPFSDRPMLKLGADLQYLISIGRTPVIVEEFGADGYQFLETPAFSEYVASFGVGALSRIPDYSTPVGSITDDGYPTCYPITPVGTGLCPPGYVYDVATETCVPLPPPPPVVPPPIPPPPTPPPTPPGGPPPTPPPPPLGQPDPQGDEIVDQLCAQMQANTAALINAVNSLAGDGGLGAAACCAAVVNAIAGIEATLIRILTILPGLAPPKTPPLDVAAVVTELTCICEQLTALASGSGAIPSSITDAAGTIAHAVANAPHTDLKPVVDAINAFAKIVDVKQPVIDYLVKNNLLDPEMAQIAGSADLGDTLANFYSKYGKYIVAGCLDTLGGSIASGHAIVPDPEIPAQRDLGSVFGSMLKNVDSIFEPLLKPIITGLLVQLAPPSVPPIGQAGVSLDAPAATAFGVAFTAAAASYIMSFFGLDAGATLAWVAELLSGAVGWEELRDLRLKPFIEHGIAKVVQMEAKARFQQELPGNGALAGWTARGLMDQARADELMTLNGLHFSLRPIALEAATSGLNARMMLRLVGTGLFKDADVVDELTFSGMRQSSQHRLVLAAAYLGSEPERGKFRSALESAYRAGMVSDNDFVSRLESAEHNTDRTNLLLETVQLEKQIVLAKEYEGAYSREFLAGLLDIPGYQSALEGLGMQPADIAARMFRDETHVNVTTSIQAARQARAQQRAEASAERKAAIEAYRTGNSNEAALAAALSLTGLSPTQVLAMTTYQVLASSGVLRWIFGLHLPPSQATLLRQRVSDLTRQREIEMLSDSQYVSALSALGIPSNYINVLRAGANAHISPKTAAVLTPVSTG